jgi:hypothetical protein
MTMPTHTIEKVLTANDTGETGGHQAGICVPKDSNILSFFPALNSKLKNPREVIDIIDDAGRDWAFAFIYYNNRFFGGTRNEYRLTGMTAFFREFNLKAGDKIMLHRESEKTVRITFKRASASGFGKVLKLSTSWKVIDANF